MTKRFEEVLRGSVAEVLAQLEERTLKGEIVLLVGRAEAREMAAEDLDAAIDAALENGTVKDAAAEIAKRHGLKRRDVYQRALVRAKEREDGEA